MNRNFFSWVLACTLISAAAITVDCTAADPVDAFKTLVDGKRFDAAETTIHQRCDAIGTAPADVDIGAKVKELGVMANDIQCASPFDGKAQQLQDDFRAAVLALMDPGTDIYLRILDFQVSTLLDASGDNGYTSKLSADDKAKRCRDLIARGTPVVKMMNAMTVDGYKPQRVVSVSNSIDMEHPDAVDPKAAEKAAMAKTNAQQSALKDMHRTLESGWTQVIDSAFAGTGDSGRADAQKAFKDMAYTDAQAEALLAGIHF